MCTDQGLDCRFVAQKKWDKGSKILSFLKEELLSSSFLNYKELLSSTGFLIHLAMTYLFMKPCMKGLYLTLNLWRPNRDPEGWPLKSLSSLDGEDGDKEEQKFQEKQRER